jgi:predicted amidohydrolase YtcJ
VLTQPRKLKEALEGVEQFRKEFNTEHMKVHTLKIFMDGTLKIETAAMATPYEDGVLICGSRMMQIFLVLRSWEYLPVSHLGGIAAT